MASAQESAAAINLRTLQKIDPSIHKVHGTASHVVMYSFDEEKNEWVSTFAHY